MVLSQLITYAMYATFRTEFCGGGTGLRCIKNCVNRKDGDYQSCKGCNVYATCSNGILYDERPCAPSNPPLVWDDVVKRCQWRSTTCRKCWAFGSALVNECPRGLDPFNASLFRIESDLRVINGDDWQRAYSIWLLRLKLFPMSFAACVIAELQYTVYAELRWIKNPLHRFKYWGPFKILILDGNVMDKISILNREIIFDLYYCAFRMTVLFIIQ